MMFRHSRATDASTSLRPHHQRWISEPSSSMSAVATGAQTTRTSTQQGKVAAVAARQQDGTSKTTGVCGRYQKNRSSSTLDRDTKATSAASKTSLSSTLQQLGDWARRSFRGQGGGGKRAVSRRPKSLNNYVMMEVSSGVVVERKSEKLHSSTASRDPSPVTTSSGYASSGEGVYGRLHDGDFEDGEGRRLKKQLQRGASRGSRRYRRRASMYVGTQEARPPPTPSDQAVRRPSEVSAMINDEKRREIQLPVYENIALKCATKEDSMPVCQTQCLPSHTRRLDSMPREIQSNSEVDRQLQQLTAEVVMDTGNISIDDYLLPTERSSLTVSSNSSTLRRTGNGSNPVYVNGNLLMTSMSRSCRGRQDDSARRSRSLSSSRNRTLTDDQSTTFNFCGVQQRLTFTPSFVAPSPSPADPADVDADWDDRLSTLSLGCRRPHVSPDRRCTTQRPSLRQPRSKSARRRLMFDSYAVTSVDQRPEAIEECVRPLFKKTGPPPTISNVPARSPPARRPTGLFPTLGDNEEESIYETINDVVERSRFPVSRGPNKGPEMDSEHLYDNVDDIVDPATTDIHQIPPPLPPPPLPARRPTAGSEIPLCRSDVVELDSHHVYTIADVLDSFEALAAHLPRAQRFIYDLQLASYLDRRRHLTEHAGEGDRGRRTVKDSEKRWTAAAAMSRASSNHGADDKNSTLCNGAAQRRLHHAAAMFNSDDSQPIIVEDYVCSPGNQLSTDQTRRASNSTSTVASTTANPIQGDGLYIPMKSVNKSSASTVFCCGGRGSATLDARPPNTFLSAADAARRSKQLKRTDKESRRESRRMSTTMSQSVIELDQRGRTAGNRNNVGEGRRASKPFQMPSNFIDASSYMLTNSQLPVDMAQHHKALSRSLMDGISYQQSRPPSGNFADRKQNSYMTSSLFAGDVATDRSYALLEMSSDNMAVLHPHYTPRSASEHLQTGTGSSPKVKSPVAVGRGHHPNNKSSYRSRATDRPTIDLSQSLAAESTVPQHPTSSGPPSSSSTSTSFHELPPQSDRRRSSVLQWTAASCSGREIFC